MLRPSRQPWQSRDADVSRPLGIKMWAIRPSYRVLIKSVLDGNADPSVWLPGRWVRSSPVGCTDLIGLPLLRVPIDPRIVRRPSPRIYLGVPDGTGAIVFRVNILRTPECFNCGPEETLLASMGRMGRRGRPAGCLGGGCGVCKIRVVTGHARPIGPMSRAHVTKEDERAGIFLACKTIPASDIEIEVLGVIGKRICFHAATITGRGDPSRALPPDAGAEPIQEG